MQNSRNPLIFVVEDNVVYNDLITGVLKAKKFTNVQSFRHPEECYKNLDKNPDIVVLDYVYTGLTGLDLMHKVHETKPWIDFIFISGQNDVSVAVKIMRQGAFDYIVKNEKALDNLISAINLAISREKRKNMRSGLRKGIILFFIIVIILILLVFSLSLFFDEFRIF